MAKSGMILMTGGVVVNDCKGNFVVEFTNSGPLGTSKTIVNAVPNGKMRINNISILVGDQVDVEVHESNLNTGRIVNRVTERSKRR